MAIQRNPIGVSGQPVGGGQIGGGRFNLPGITTSEAKTSTTSKASTPTKTKPVKMTAQPMISLSATTKLASLVQPEIARKIEPSILTINPSLIATLLEKTTTQLARGAIEQLKGVSGGVRDEAINTVKNRNISPDRLMSYLERRVKVGEVLNEMAKTWEDETRQDFAEALNMDRNKLDVMDTIVSLAILNDPDLEDELRIEHMSDTSEASLLENRRIIWQHPPPGTPIDPPYLVYVAVEYQDMMEAQEVIESILGQLVTYEGFKVPRTAVSKTRLPSGRTMALKPRS